MGKNKFKLKKHHSKEVKRENLDLDTEKSLVFESQVKIPSWTVEDSEKLYRILGWGEPYFSINAMGNVIVSPRGDHGGSLDLYELVESLKQRQIGLPLLIRFSDILGDRIERLNASFARAIAKYNYPNVYRGVFPVKCNQNRHLIQSLVKAGKSFDLGLEAGSKPELMIALALLEPNFNQSNPGYPESLLICNGYKDREYIETALLATRLGQKPIIVIEQLEELDIIIESSQKLQIKPIVGVRAKLTSQGEGHWGISTGDRAKFGLTIPQILQVVKKLKQFDMLSSLQLLHFHIGSQISAISVIKEAIREAAQIYGELGKMGASMQYLDVGGGLAVDYDGSKTNFYASKNYNTQNYANDIVSEIKESCEEKNVNPPILISESGRAIASHQSVLIFDVLGHSEVSQELPEISHNESQEHLIIRNLWEAYNSIDSENYQETYHDAIQFKEEAISLFNFGYLSLEERAKAEQLYWACCGKIMNLIQNQDYVPDDLEDLPEKMASIYYVNLSVFQSAPDSWAIDQLFPIMPIHRLQEQPTKKGVLADITCDSDGKIDKFIDLTDVKSILELHPLIYPENTKNSHLSQAPQPYYLGMFLVGAYQEIMGNLHNLFGDTNVVHIRMTPKGYEIEHLVRGDTISEVLSYVQYNAADLLETIRRRSEQALQENLITLEQAKLLLQNYEHSLSSYTYLVNS